MSEKITSSHLDRAAYIYVRQSSMDQVRHNRESRRRQYGLSDRARGLGFVSVVVIDDDLGRSGSGEVERPGFAKLVSAVCQSKVGAVFSIEASRLARNNRDWHRLTDLCALTDTLVVDHDGIYDPRHLNDRLLLGLKGTMSEFELGLIRQRSQEALRQMIARGEVLSHVSVGYVRSRNRCEMTPDRQVQSAIRGVFEKFRELGSARQVLLWYRQEQLSLPTVRLGPEGPETTWKLPVYNRILSIIKNPVYAGAFVYGRRQTRTTMREGRAHKTSGHEVPRQQWQVLIRDHHPGYISWQEYEHNQKQLEANAGMHGHMSRGAAKNGPALLAGLLRCGQCGRKLHVGYTGKGGRVQRYRCRGAHLNHGTKWCIAFGGLRVDQAVTAAVLEAVEPDGVEAAFEAWSKLVDHNDEKRRALELAVEKARYEVDRARRQYDSVDPANRLVAAELETRWNTELEKLRELEERLDGASTPADTPSEQERGRLLELGADLQELWNHPNADVRLKKRILRTVLEEIIADVAQDPPEIILRLHWAGGVHTVLRVRKNRTGRHRHSTDRRVIDVMEDLAKVCSDASIAAILNRLGYRTGAANTWTEARVRAARQYHKIPAYDSSSKRSWLTAAEAASVLGIGETSTKRLLKAGVIPGKQVVAHAPWVIRREDLDLPAVRAAVEVVKSGGRRPRPVPGQSKLPLISRT